jgi:hypothetical protein
MEPSTRTDTTTNRTFGTLRKMPVRKNVVVMVCGFGMVIYSLGLNFLASFSDTFATIVSLEVDSFSDTDSNMLCPTIPTDYGTWSQTEQNFTWTRRGRGRGRAREQEETDNNDTTSTMEVLFQETMMFPNRDTVPWKTRPNTKQYHTDSHRRHRTVVFYGSSHLRELYFSFVRLARGLDYNNMVDLGQNVTTVGSGFPDTQGNRSLCDPKRTGSAQGAYGVDLVNCGAPTIRLVPELVGKSSNNHNISVAIGFKTFVHTPDADARFLKVIDSYGLRHPDILLVDIGIWGLRGNKRGGSATSTFTPDQELEYYFSWISNNFPSSRVVWIYELPNRPRLLAPPILSRLEQMTTANASQHVLL